MGLNSTTKITKTKDRGIELRSFDIFEELLVQVMYTTVFAIVCLLALGTAWGQDDPLTSCSALGVDRNGDPLSGQPEL